MHKVTFGNFDLSAHTKSILMKTRGENSFSFVIQLSHDCLTYQELLIFHSQNAFMYLFHFGDDCRDANEKYTRCCRRIICNIMKIIT